MSNLTFNILNDLSQEAATKIIVELERRSFYTEYPENSVGLVQVISDIIQTTIQGNVNYGVEIKPISSDWYLEADSHDPTIAGFGP